MLGVSRVSAVTTGARFQETVGSINLNNTESLPEYEVGTHRLSEFRRIINKIK